MNSFTGRAFGFLVVLLWSRKKLGYGLDSLGILVRFLERTRDFLSKASRLAVGPTQVPNWWVTEGGGSFPGGEVALAGETYHLPPFNDDAMNEWSWTNAPPRSYMSCKRAALRWLLRYVVGKPVRLPSRTPRQAESQRTTNKTGTSFASKSHCFTPMLSRRH